METSPRWRVPGVRAVRWDHADYPIGFRQENLVPPRLVYLRGLIEALPPPSKCVAIVGARRCTPEGRSTARDLASGVGAAGLTVVSGLAIGIDTAAHEGAIDAGGRTIAVLASPVDRPGPMRNLGLADEIVSGAGWLLSERGVNEEVRPHDFPRRNRLVAALEKVLS